MKNKYKILFVNGAFNLAATLIFVYFNQQALVKGLEETFVSLAMLFGLSVTIGNAIFVYLLCYNLGSKPK